MGYGNTYAITEVRSTSKTTVSGGTKIINTFGNVHIWADASMYDLDAYAKSVTKGLGGRPYAKSNTDVYLTAMTDIEGSASNPAMITARYIDIDAGTSQLDIKGDSHASIKALGANVDGITELLVNIDVDTEVSGAVLRGYDRINVTSTSAPASRTNNVYGHAYAYLGAIGHGTAWVRLDFDAATNTTIGSNVTMYGADVNIHNEVFSGKVDFARDIGGFIHKDRDGYQYIDSVTGQSVANGTKFYIGDAAAGIVIDIYEKNSATHVRHVGLKNEQSIFTILADKVRIGNITNNLAGYLNMGEVGGKYKVYDQMYIPYVTIINRTDLDVEIANITVRNDNYIKPVVSFDRKSDQKYSDVITVYETDYTTPVITVENRGSGNVHVAGFIANERGEVKFIWIDPDELGKNGSLTSAQKETNTTGAGVMAKIWAHKLAIVNAKNVGASESERLNAWLFTLGGLTQATDPADSACEEATVNVTATGNV